MEALSRNSWLGIARGALVSGAALGDAEEGSDLEAAHGAAGVSREKWPKTGRTLLTWGAQRAWRIVHRRDPQQTDVEQHTLRRKHLPLA